MFRGRRLFAEGYGEMKLKAVLGIMLTLLLTGMLTLAFNIQPAKAESGTIYIRADGSVDPPASNVTSVDNITYTFTGNIYDSIVIARDNIVVDGDGYTVQGTGSVGIALSHRNNVTLKNVEVKNFYVGIRLEYSSNNILTGNTASNNLNGIYVISSSNNNVLINNTASSNFYTGIRLISSSNNILTGNTASNSDNGIQLWSSSNNTLIGNTASNNNYGIYLYSSSNNILTGNTASSNNENGIYLQSSSDNTITNNTASSNNYGISLWWCSNNTIFHNNFINNTFKTYVTPGYANTWDNGYPSGGNYWSDFTGVDVKSGPNQDQPSSDGIGDTPYVIDADNRDRYQLMYPWGSPPPPSYTLTIHSSPTGITFTVDGVPRTTPWSGTYSKGSLVTLEMPQNQDGHIWSQWLEDGDTNRMKTVTVNTNITLTGTFPPVPAPVNMVELLAPYIGLAILLAVAVVTVVYVKKRKKYGD